MPKKSPPYFYLFAFFVNGPAWIEAILHIVEAVNARL